MTTVQYMGLAQQVYYELKRMIVDKELKPGEKLLQEKLSAKLGVSRTPLLKALQMLESEFLVESKPRRGLYVREISTREMIDVFDCRGVIEGLAVRLAVDYLTDDTISELYRLFNPFKDDIASIDIEKYERVDRQFHYKLMHLHANELLYRMENISSIHILAYQQGLLRPPEETLPEHFEIIKALENRKGEKAEAEMRRHLHLSKLALIQKLEE